MFAKLAHDLLPSWISWLLDDYTRQSQHTALEQRRQLVALRALLHSFAGASMSVVIEDITDRDPAVRVAQDDAHEVAVRQEDDEEFHDAADSEDSYEDATEHFDVDALHAAQQRAQPAADAGEFRMCYIEHW